MSTIPIFNAVRIIPRDETFLNRKLGSRGEIFYDRDSNTLRLFDGNSPGGVSLAKDDLSNIDNLAFRTKAAAAGVGAGAATISAEPPESPFAGDTWVDENTGIFYVYYDDGTSAQWIQPATSMYGAGGASGGATTLNSLTDVVITGATVGQVLKYNGTNWINDSDSVSSAGSTSNSFSTISVAGQASVLADSSSDTLTLVAGAGITLITNATTDTITINSTSSGLASNSFSTISVAGQSSVLADSSSDTLTLVAGTGITLATNATTDSITINSTVSAGVTAFTGLSDAAGLTVDKFYLPAITMLSVTNSGASAYRFDQYGAINNPTIFAINATTIAFNLNVSGHPFLIQNAAGVNYNIGLFHVSTAGVVSTGASAQGQTSGTLYWKIPDTISGGYRYQCSAHAPMVGSISIKTFSTL